MGIAHRLAPALLALALSCGARGAEACAACGCGDPTLVSAGTEQPFAGRFRVSFEGRYRTDSVGEPGVDEIRIHETRGDLGVAWAPADWLFVLASLPLVHRSITETNLATERSWGPGDAELRAKAYVYRDRALAPRWLVALVGGLKFPTAPFHEDSDGELLPLEAQAGTGSWDFLFGPSLSFFEDWFSLYASAQATLPFATRDELKPGLALRSTLALQAQVIPALAVRAITETRLDSAAEVDGRDDPDSGGFVLFAGADVLVSPVMDLVLSAGFRLPALQALNGFHDEGAVFVMAASYDF
ncbi:MAG TPA: hypothetical protein VGK73_30705 [Polyangiaceae bacterium]